MTLRINQIEESKYYCIDLFQSCDGRRFIDVREELAIPRGDAVLTSAALSGAQLREFLVERRMNDAIKTTGGELFGLDPHNSWMLAREIEYWKSCRKNDVADWSNGPWVNGKPPRFAP